MTTFNQYDLLFLLRVGEHVVPSSSFFKSIYFSPVHRWCSHQNRKTPLRPRTSGVRDSRCLCVCWSTLIWRRWGWRLTALAMKISDFTRHLPFAWSLPVHGIAMATGDSSLRRVSTVTDLLSFISVARATQPCLIDGISALPQQQGWEAGLLVIDFRSLRNPASPCIHPPTHTLSSPTPLVYKWRLCLLQASHTWNFPCMQAHAHTGLMNASTSFKCIQMHEHLIRAYALSLHT